MAAGFREELVFAQTEDGIDLSGVIIGPDGVEPRGRPVVWIHGSANHFCERSYVDIGRALARSGHTLVSVNTRGHDGMALFWRGGHGIVVAGSAWERFDIIPLDISAWIDCLAARGHRSVILAGHSLGASKVVYYQAERQDERVHSLILASPAVSVPCLPERSVLAARMIEDGRGEELLPHLEGSPAWNIISAQTVVSREQIIAPTFEVATGEPSIAAIRCPILAFYGSTEEEAAASLATIERNSKASVRCKTALVRGADHNYRGREKMVATLLSQWITTL